MASHNSRAKNPFYCRKEKSLGLLCTNFLRLYNRDDVDSIGLDAAALQLGVERRRVYDIVNILQSIGVLLKKAKNQYTWKGFGVLSESLIALKEQGLKEGFHTCLSNVSNRKECIWPDKCSDPDKGDSLEHRKEKSLGLVTQNFIKLFLCSDVDYISLDCAALALLGDGHDRTAMRTKVRRLYDVANVLSSMGLLEKIRDPESGKPAFRWLGMGGSCRNVSSTALDMKNSKREFGTDITNTVIKRCNTNTSSSSKLNTEKHSQDIAKNAKDGISTEQHQKYGSEDFVFGPFTPNVANSAGNEYRKVCQIMDLDSLFRAYQPHYSNQAIGELIHHYAEAWNYWNDEAKDQQVTR